MFVYWPFFLLVILFLFLLLCCYVLNVCENKSNSKKNLTDKNLGYSWKINSSAKGKKVFRQRPRSAMPWKTLENGLEPAAPNRPANWKHCALSTQPNPHRQKKPGCKLNLVPARVVEVFVDRKNAHFSFNVCWFSPFRWRRIDVTSWCAQQVPFTWECKRSMYGIGLMIAFARNFKEGKTSGSL